MRKRLLIADDDTLFCSLLTNGFEQNNDVEVTTVHSISSAKESLAKGKHDLVVLDIKFGHESGIEILKHMNESGNTTPVIVVTNFPRSMHGPACAAYGVKDYIVKTDWKLATLIERIKTHAQVA